VHVIELPHLWVGSCGVQRVDEVRATPLSRVNHQVLVDTTGTRVPQAHKPRKKNLVFILCMIGFLLVIGLHLIVIGSFLDVAV
jgi:hypothetical protein